VISKLHAKHPQDKTLQPQGPDTLTGRAKCAGTREIGWRLYFRLRSIICHEGMAGHNTAPAKIQ
jgi:hypothetical protein